MQAAKAQERYQEYSARLKELRVAISLEEFHDVSGKLAGEQTPAWNEAETGAGRRQTRRRRRGTWTCRGWRPTVAHLDQATREQEGLLASVPGSRSPRRGPLARSNTRATSRPTSKPSWRRRAVPFPSLALACRRLAEQSAPRRGRACRDAELAGQEQRLGVQALDDELLAVVQRLTELQTQCQSDHELQLEQMQRRIRLENDAIGAKARLDGLTAERQRLIQRSEQAAEHLASIDVELQELTAAEETLQAELAAARQSLADQRQERERLRQLHDETAQLVGDLKAQRTGLTSRVEVLEGLERSHEGLGTGVREVLALREQTDAGPWRTLLGMIADVLNVRREYAPLIDLALGDWSQRAPGARPGRACRRA